MATERPIDISCSNLDALRRQYSEEGHVTVSLARPINNAREAVLEVVAPGLIRLKRPGPEDVLDVPFTDDPHIQQMITEAREQSLKSKCWWRKVGCVVFDDDFNIIGRNFNNPVGSGNFCEGLEIDQREVMKLLAPGERLEFCTARHDVASMVSEAALKGIPIGQKNWGLSLEPCDHCANLLVGVEAKGVYIDLRSNYYSPLGIQILQSSDIPTYFVKMPE